MGLGLGSVHGVVRVVPCELGASAALGGEVVVGVDLGGEGEGDLLRVRARVRVRVRVRGGGAAFDGEEVRRLTRRRKKLPATVGTSGCNRRYLGLQPYVAWYRVSYGLWPYAL